jgi:hypothetical protein
VVSLDEHGFLSVLLDMVISFPGVLLMGERDLFVLSLVPSEFSADRLHGIGKKFGSPSDWLDPNRENQGLPSQSVFSLLVDRDGLEQSTLMPTHKRFLSLNFESSCSKHSVSQAFWRETEGAFSCRPKSLFTQHQRPKNGLKPSSKLDGEPNFSPAS